MKINELKPGQGKVNIKGKVTELGTVREFEKFGKPGKVANAKMADDTGKITLTLWNEEIDKVKEGSNVEITNGWVKEYQGEMQVTAGRFGELHVLSADQSADEKVEQEDLHGLDNDEGQHVLTEDEKTESDLLSETTSDFVDEENVKDD